VVARAARASGLADGLDDRGEDLLQLARQRGGDRGDLAGGELAEGGGEEREGRRVAVEGAEGFFRVGGQPLVPEAGPGAGHGERLQGLQHLDRHAATAAGEAFDLGELGIALLRPLGGRGGGVAGGGDFGEAVVVFPDVVPAERFADLARGVGALRSAAGRSPRWRWMRASWLRDAASPGWLRSACPIRSDSPTEARAVFEAAPRGGLVALRAGGFAFVLAEDAEVVGGLAEAALVLQGDGDLPGFLVPGARFGQTASVLFDDAEESCRSASSQLDRPPPGSAFSACWWRAPARGNWPRSPARPP
jgi:hypothetical protein